MTDQPKDHSTVHISIDECATDTEAEQFTNDLAEWVGEWVEEHPERGKWDPSMHWHTESCDDSDHCHGPGSWVERHVAARALREAASEIVRPVNSSAWKSAYRNCSAWLRARADALEPHNTPVATPSGPSAGLEGQGATQETQDATEAAQGRVERYAEAMDAAYVAYTGISDPATPMWQFNPSKAHREISAPAAAAVADREQAEKDATIAELRAEVERLRKPTVAAVMGYELGAGDLERAEARVAELEATVAKVRDLADEWAAEPVPDDVDDYDSSAVNSYAQAETTVWCGQTLRAILDAPKDSGAAS